MNEKDKIEQLFNFPFLKESNRAVYFIGIGGIGMSALARFFQEKGFHVSGYDKTPSVLTEELVKAGIPVHYDDDVNAVPASPEMVVYTPAVPAALKELKHCRDKGYNVIKRSDALAVITANSFNICIAGTHGKTTITTLIGHILRHSGFGCNAFLGGIAVNYDTNFWSSERNVCVVEADEYDRSFLKLNPDIAIVTAMDADHLDIYGTSEAMEDAFIQFGSKVSEGGCLIAKFGLDRSTDLKSASKNRNADYYTYSLQNSSSRCYAENITIIDGGYKFDVVTGDSKIEGVKLNMGGMHNVENTVAAITVAFRLQIDPDKIKDAVTAFKGIRRRFEYIVKNETIVYIDDYAHHPEELRVLITGAKTLFRQRKCTVIFQPHLYSRTRDLASGFGKALDLADEVILLPIYPARELPMQGISSELILEKMEKKNKRVDESNAIVKWIRTNYIKNINSEFGEILITAGAGDIDMMVQPIKNELNEIRA